MAYKIMIVEDDSTIVQVLQRQLQKWDYEIYPVTDFSHVVQQFVQISPHLVVLDISLPFYNGYYWCEQIRSFSRVPILFLSCASDDMSLVMAISQGADDFIAKPFNLPVLTAKIQAMLRRAYAFGSDPDVKEYRGMVFSLGDASITCGDQRQELTKNESRILQLLLEHRGQAVRRDTLIRALWEDESFIDDNTLTVNITRLRKKLEGIGLNGLIRTKKGIGYLLEE